MICRRVQEMKSFIVMDVLERAQEIERAGESVIHLEVGEPDFDTPEAIKAAAVEALHRGETHYTHSLGTTNSSGKPSARGTTRSTAYKTWTLTRCSSLRARPRPS